MKNEIIRLFKFYFSKKEKVRTEVNLGATLESHKKITNLEILKDFQVVNQFLRHKIEDMPRDDKMKGKLCYFELKFEDCFPISIIEKEYSARKLTPVGFNVLTAIDANWIKNNLPEYPMLGTTFNHKNEQGFFFLRNDAQKVAVLEDGVIAYNIIFFGFE